MASADNKDMLQAIDSRTGLTYPKYHTTQEHKSNPNLFQQADSSLRNYGLWKF
jgi:hypothetical protein